MAAKAKDRKREAPLGGERRRREIRIEAMGDLRSQSEATICACEKKGFLREREREKRKRQ